MPGKPSNEDLEQRIIELEEEILKKRNAEEALRESEEKYCNIFEHAGLQGIADNDNPVLENREIRAMECL